MKFRQMERRCKFRGEPLLLIFEVAITAAGGRVNSILNSGRTEETVTACGYGVCLTLEVYSYKGIGLICILPLQKMKHSTTVIIKGYGKKKKKNVRQSDARL